MTSSPESLPPLGDSSAENTEQNRYRHSESGEQNDPLSAEEIQARNSVVNFSKERIIYINTLNNINPHKKQYYVRIYGAYIGAANENNFFGEITEKDEHESKSVLLPIYPAFFRMAERANANAVKSESNPRQRDFYLQEAARLTTVLKSIDVAVAGRFKLENIELKRINVKTTDEVYAIVTRIGQPSEEHIPLYLRSYKEGSTLGTDIVVSKEVGTNFPPNEEEIVDAEVVDDNDGGTTPKFITEKMVDVTARDLTDDMVVEARLAHLRLETVRRAFDNGYEDPVNFLLKCRSNKNLAKRMKILGYDLSPPPENEVPQPEYPGREQSEVGRKRRTRDLEIIEQLRSTEGIKDILKDLKPPSDLPLRLHKIPGARKVIGSLKMRWYAGRVYKKDRKDRSERQQEDGIFGFGLKGRKKRLDSIKRLDKQTLSERSNLSRMNRHQLDDDSGGRRRDEAQQIHRTIDMLQALYKNSSLMPGDFYEHEPYDKRLKAYREGLNKAKIEAERAEFLKLRRLGTRDQAQQRRYVEIGEKMARREFDYIDGLESRTPRQQARLDELSSEIDHWEIWRLEGLSIRTPEQEERLGELKDKHHER